MKSGKFCVQFPVQTSAILATIVFLATICLLAGCGKQESCKNTCAGKCEHGEDGEVAGAWRGETGGGVSLTNKP